MNTRPAAGFRAAVIALKNPARAKSRLQTLPDELRQELSWSMALDTLAALRAALEVVLVVGDPAILTPRLRASGLDLEVADERGAPAPGLNPALTLGADLLRDRGATTTLACVGDLPALTSESLHRVLLAARPHARAFLPDADGAGTTMLLAAGAPLDPRFGEHSALAHAGSGAAVLDLAGVAGAQRDVDTEADLVGARRIGVGAHTARVIERHERLRLPRSA